MNCYVCGKEVREGARFCPNCGANLANAPTPEPEVILEDTVFQEPETPPVDEIPTEEQPQQEEKSPYEFDPVPQPAQKPEPTQRRRAFWLPENRSLWKMILFGILTFGIYDLAVLSRIPEETNMVINGRDGNRTQQFWWMVILTFLTFGIYYYVWNHGLCNRIGDELKRRELNGFEFSASDFWIWDVLGSVIAGFVLSILSTIVAVVGVFAGMNELTISSIAFCLSLLSMIGPCVFLHRLCKAVNLMNKDYNLKG